MVQGAGAAPILFILHPRQNSHEEILVSPTWLAAMGKSKLAGTGKRKAPKPKTLSKAEKRRKEKQREYERKRSKNRCSRPRVHMEQGWVHKMNGVLFEARFAHISVPGRNLHGAAIL